MMTTTQPQYKLYDNNKLCQDSGTAEPTFGTAGSSRLVFSASSLCTSLEKLLWLFASNAYNHSVCQEICIDYK